MCSHKGSAVGTAAATVDASDNFEKGMYFDLYLFGTDLTAFQIAAFQLCFEKQLG